MHNDKALLFFEEMANDANSDEKSLKLASGKDLSEYDSAFLQKYLSGSERILDLGTGSGLVVNKICPYAGHITAVEPFTGFSKYIVNDSKISIVNKTLLEFKTDEKYDIVTIFGVMHYFNEDEARTIYAKYSQYLSSGGFFIVKNQLGVHEDVTVEGVSKELGKEYFAQYRALDKEVKMLEAVGLTEIDVVDIYPAEHNRWENTHYYALVARKP